MRRPGAVRHLRSARAAPASAQWRAWTSRMPPRPSFRSGSSRNATSPNRQWRATTDSASSCSRRFDRCRHASTASVDSSSVKLIGTGQVAGRQQGRGRVEVVVGERQRLVDRAHRVTEFHPGVPDRIPQRLSELLDVRRPAMHEHQVEIAERGELGAAVATDGHQGDVAPALAPPRRRATRASGRPVGSRPRRSRCHAPTGRRGASAGRYRFGRSPKQFRRSPRGDLDSDPTPARRAARTTDRGRPPRWPSCRR